MKPTNFYGFQARDFAGFTLESAHFRSFKTAFISWFHLESWKRASQGGVMATVRFEEDEDVILVEFEDEYGIRSVSSDPAEFVEKSKKAIERSMKTVQRMAKKAVRTIQSIPISERPSKFEFQFGIKMNGEAGAVVAKAGAEASITVTMTWEHKGKK
jgi:hypothetical protein